MKKLPAILAITCLLYSCLGPQKKAEKVAGTDTATAIKTADVRKPKQVIPAFTLAGKTYHVEQEGMDDRCRQTYSFVCGTSFILFPDDRRFIETALCHQGQNSDDTHYHGLYRIDGDKVYLKYEGYGIEVLWRDTVPEMTKVEVASAKGLRDTLRAFICDAGILGFELRDGYDALPEPGSNDSTMRDDLKSMYRQGILQRLGFMYDSSGR